MKAKKLRIVLALAGLLATESSVNAHKASNSVSTHNASNKETGRIGNTSDAFLYQPNNAIDEENFYTGVTGEAFVQGKAVVTAHTRALENKVNDLTRQAKTTNRAVKQIQKEHAQLKKEKKENK